MYHIMNVNQKHEITKQIPIVQVGVRACRRKQVFAKQIPAVQVEVRARRKKLVFAKQTPRHTRDQTGSRRKNLFLQNKRAAGTHVYTVASPWPAHGFFASRFPIPSSHLPTHRISADFARYNFLGATAGNCHNRRGSK